MSVIYQHKNYTESISKAVNRTDTKTSTNHNYRVSRNGVTVGCNLYSHTATSRHPCSGFHAGLFVGGGGGGGGMHQCYDKILLSLGGLGTCPLEKFLNLRPF